MFRILAIAGSLVFSLAVHATKSAKTEWPINAEYTEEYKRLLEEYGNIPLTALTANDPRLEFSVRTNSNLKFQDLVPTNGSSAQMPKNFAKEVLKRPVDSAQHIKEMGKSVDMDLSRLLKGMYDLAVTRQSKGSADKYKELMFNAVVATKMAIAGYVTDQETPYLVFATPGESGGTEGFMIFSGDTEDPSLTHVVSLLLRSELVSIKPPAKPRHEP